MDITFPTVIHTYVRRQKYIWNRRSVPPPNTEFYSLFGGGGIKEWTEFEQMMTIKVVTSSVNEQEFHSHNFSQQHLIETWTKSPLSKNQPPSPISPRSYWKHFTSRIIATSSTTIISTFIQLFFIQLCLLCKHGQSLGRFSFEINIKHLA